MSGKMQESGLTDVIPVTAPQLSGASILCFLILSLLRAHHPSGYNVKV